MNLLDANENVAEYLSNFITKIKLLTSNTIKYDFSIKRSLNFNLIKFTKL